MLQWQTLSQTGADEQSQAPQGLGLRSTTPISWATIKLYPELTLDLFLKDRVMLGGSQ